jgi:hypothetical protein
MSPHPVKYKGYAYRTAEALFQCMRFEDEEIQTLIWDQPSPMGAKMVAKGKRELMKVAPQSDTDIENMENVLTMKTDQHSKIESQLLATGDRLIVEDCTKRASRSGLFWGAALRDGHWEGENKLGQLWMELRSRIQKGDW